MDKRIKKKPRDIRPDAWLIIMLITMLKRYIELGNWVVGRQQRLLFEKDGTFFEHGRFVERHNCHGNVRHSVGLSPSIA